MNATKTILLCAAVSAVAGCTTEPATGPGKTETAEMPATGLPIREGPFEYPVEASDFAAATPERLRKEVWDRINADLAAFWPNRPWRDQEEARLAALGASRGDGVDLTALAPDSGMRIGASLQCAAVPDGWPEADIAFGFVLALTKTIDGSTPGYDLHAAETLLARGYSTLPRGKRPFPYISKEQLADVVRATWAAGESSDGSGKPSPSGSAERTTQDDEPNPRTRVDAIGLPAPPPFSAKLLAESGAFALFAGETEEDAAFNEAERRKDPETPLFRNSLFACRHAEDGTDEWRLLLTTGSDWRTFDAANAWCASREAELKRRFVVRKARFASDGRLLWLVCDTQSYTYLTVCYYDTRDGVFRVLTDGDTADEEPDGTIRVRNKKTYLRDENGNSLGAAWYDEWLLPDGTVVRKTEPTQSGNVR